MDSSNRSPTKKKTRNKKKNASKKKKKKKKRQELSVVEQRLAEAQRQLEEQEREEKIRIFKAWKHDFDDDGFLYYSNSVLKKQQFECPRGYKTGYVSLLGQSDVSRIALLTAPPTRRPLPTPSEHLWQDVFAKLDTKRDGFITIEQISASMTAEGGGSMIANRSKVKRRSEKFIQIFSRTPRFSNQITKADWEEMTKRLPSLTTEQIERFVKQFKLRDKAYYREDDSSTKDSDVANTGESAVANSTVPPENSPWQETTDEETGQTYYVNAETGETSWERPE